METEPALVVLGRVVGVHGLRGQVRVRYFGDGPDNLLSVEDVWLAESPEGAGAETWGVRACGTGRGGEVRLALEGVETREQAQDLRGRYVLAQAGVLPPLPDGEYYWHELIGCRVEDTAGRAIGTVREILETGAHDVLAIEAEDGRRHLVPTAEHFLREVDVPGRRLVVELVPGLIDGD